MPNDLLSGLDRTQFAGELADPALRQKLLASIQAEVGDQPDAAKLAYVESVMNRASARGLSLDQTISDKSYYPKETTSQLGNQPPPAVTNTLNPLVDQALSGSNVSNFATGNESGKLRTNPVTFSAPGLPEQKSERFVIEDADRKWAARQGQSLAPAGTGMTSVPSLASAATMPMTPDLVAKRIAELNAAIGLTKRKKIPSVSSVGNLSMGYAPRAELVNP
jgi:hypothetical protein